VIPRGGLDSVHQLVELGILRGDQIGHHARGDLAGLLCQSNLRRAFRVRGNSHLKLQSKPILARSRDRCGIDGLAGFLFSASSVISMT